MGRSKNNFGFSARAEYNDSRWKAKDKKTKNIKKKTQNGKSDRYKLEQAFGCVAFSLLSFSFTAFWLSDVLMSANLRESYHCFIYGPQSFFVYGLLALSVFCTYISWLYSKSRNSTLLSFYGARSRPWCFSCQVLGFLKIYIQHHEKRWGKMTAPGGFFRTGFCLVCFGITGFFLGFGYNSRNG